MKKWLKIGLIVCLLAILGLIWIVLTNLGIIPNILNIKGLYNCINCNGKVFCEGEFVGQDGKYCCEGTYSISGKTFGGKCYRVSNI